jgi:riboflavin kinase/FMN adenylyltransferase
MLMVRGRTEIAAALGRPLRRAAVTIGNFDGVHRGHQALVATARELATRAQGDVVALTFDPHPARLFAPELAPPLIASMDRRAELLGEAGADVVVVEPFTHAFAGIEADAFARDVLGRDLSADHVVVGYDFTFGRGRNGDTSLLQELGAKLGFGVTVVRRVSVHGLTCSSTKIREFALAGRVEGAQVLLGRPFEVTGEVVRGAGRGRTIGFPTANLRVEADLVPRVGIYAARARVLGADGKPAATATCAVSIGTNPTFSGGGAVHVEAYLLDFEGDLYGRRLRLEFSERLRDERRFESVDQLVAQIRDDVARVRDIVT